MGNVTRIVHAVNRSLEPLEVMDDGVVWTIRPGYVLTPKKNEKGEGIFDKDGKPVFEIIGSGPGGSVLMEALPYFAAERAKRQNPVMGTEDPQNPNSFESLIAVPEWGDDYGYMGQTEAIERLDRSMLPAELQNIDVREAVGGRKPLLKRDPQTGRFQRVIPGARAFVRGEAVAVNPGIISQNLG